MNLDDDAFWDSQVIDTGTTLGLVPDSLGQYGRVLEECFPFVRPFEGLALGKQPRACSILGSHLIEVNDVGEAKWWQTIGSRPIPPDFNFGSPRLGQKIPPATCFRQRKCKSPKDFRLWLQIVVADIRKTAYDMILDALSPDNLVSQPAVTLQQAHNLAQIGVRQWLFGQAEQPLPVHTWFATKDRNNTFYIPLLRKGQMQGQIILGWRDDAWRYGVVVNATLFGTELKVKHQAASTVQLRHRDVAEAAAVRLYYQKMFDFLVDTALNNPTLRGA